LDIETIKSRIEKLEKRRQRSKEQFEDATRHVEGYQAERNFREQEAAAAANDAKE
jgi:prefoldin subunit 5